MNSMIECAGRHDMSCALNAPNAGDFRNWSSTSPGSASPRPSCHPALGHLLSTKRANCVVVMGITNSPRKYPDWFPRRWLAYIPWGSGRSFGTHDGYGILFGSLHEGSVGRDGCVVGGCDAPGTGVVGKAAPPPGDELLHPTNTTTHARTIAIEGMMRR